mgnify:CR=1 FL=1
MANRTIMLKDADKFREIVTKAGFSYRQLAKEARCSQTQISLIANGERNPSPETAVNICRALEKQFDDIFFIKNDFKRNQN